MGQLLNVVHTSTKDIGMEYGLDKWAKCSLRAGRLISPENIQLGGDIEIRDLKGQEIYKHLAIEENGTLQHAKMREKIS